MRFIHSIHSANPAGGGPVTAARALGDALVGLGHECEMVTLDDPRAPWLSEVRWPVHALGPGLRGYGYSNRFVPGLRKLLRPGDNVLIHGLWLYNGAGAWRAFRGAQRPRLFLMPHGMLDPWFRRAYPLRHLKKLLYWLLIERRIARDAIAVLFTSAEERRLARTTFRPYRCREEVIGLGIEDPGVDAQAQIDAFRAAYPALADRPYLLFLGRLHPKKGLDLLVESFRSVFRPSTSADRRVNPRLIVAGPCPDTGYLTALKTLATRLGVTQADLCAPGAALAERADLIWLPMLGGAVKWGALGACEAFVLPSHQENFGIAVVEALACARPVLISQNVNIWREIAEAGAGLAEPDTLAGTIRLLDAWRTQRTEAPDAQQTRCARARACFEARFDIRSVATRLVAVCSC